MSDKYINQSGLQTIWNKITSLLGNKQDTLVSGTNIKTVNNTSLLGSGNIDISGGGSNDNILTGYFYFDADKNEIVLQVYGFISGSTVVTAVCDTASFDEIDSNRTLSKFMAGVNATTITVKDESPSSMHYTLGGVIEGNKINADMVSVGEQITFVIDPFNTFIFPLPNQEGIEDYSGVLIAEEAVDKGEDIVKAYYSGKSVFVKVLNNYGVFEYYRLERVIENGDSYNLECLGLSLEFDNYRRIVFRVSDYWSILNVTDGVFATLYDLSGLAALKQDQLISGTNIKTINGNSLLGSGNLQIDGVSLQTQDNWKYKIYDNNSFECWYKATGQTMMINNSSGNLYRSALTSLACPSNLYNNYTVNIIHADINVAHNNYPAWGMLASIYDTGINYYGMSGGSRGASNNYTITAYMMGTLS